MRKEQWIPILLSVLITLLVIIPLFYITHRNIPPSIATIDLQLLVEENQQHLLNLVGNKSNFSEKEHEIAEKSTIDFAKKLSLAISTLEQECRCILVNKAAVLGGEKIDYTQLIRARLKP